MLYVCTSSWVCAPVCTLVLPFKYPKVVYHINIVYLIALMDTDTEKFNQFEPRDFTGE